METYDFMRILGERRNRVDRLYYRWAKAHGLSYNVLAVLYVSYKDPQSTQTVVSEEWSLPKQTVNTVCKNLCKRGLLTLQKSVKDGRETVLCLTDEGKKLAQPIVNELLAVESQILSRMGEKNSQLLLELYTSFCYEAEILLSCKGKTNYSKLHEKHSRGKSKTD